MLDATTKDTALKSLSQYLGIEATQLSQIFKELQIPKTSNPSEYLLEYIESEFSPTQKRVEGVFFHASRVRSTQTFWDAGIRTKSDIQEELYSYLQELSKDIPHDGEYKSGMSISERESFGELDEGPFAYLLRDESFSNRAGDRDYTHMPELVQDIAGELCGENNYQRLLDKFTHNTIPCVVHFQQSFTDDEVGKFIYFVYLNCQGYELSESIDLAKHQYNSQGSPIAADHILKVEKL